jgi:hypothetical protein
MKTPHGVILFFVLLLFSASAWCVPTIFVDTTEFFSDQTFELSDLDGYGGQYVNEFEYSMDSVSWTHSFTPLPGVISAELTLYMRAGDLDIVDAVTDDGMDTFVVVPTHTLTVTPSSLTDGEYHVELTSILGDSFIDKSELSITYEPETGPPIPEASTLLLMGSGLPGLVLWARSRRRKTRA